MMRALIVVLGVLVAAMSLPAAFAQPGDGHAAPAAVDTPPAVADAVAPSTEDPAALSAEERAAYIAALIAEVDQVEALVLTKLAAKMATQNDARFDLITDILLGISAAGLLLLLLPLYLRRRYPGRGRELFRLSATAAGLFIVTMLVFSLLLVVFKGTQAELAQATNPQLQLTSAAFEAVKNNVDDLVEVAPLLIAAPLAQIANGAAEDVPSALLQNVSAFARDISAFKSLAGFFRWVKGVLGLLPVLLSLMVVALFLVTQKDIILTIIRLPERVASGQATSAEVTRLVRRRLVAEAITTAILLAGLVVLMILTTLAMTVIAVPAAEALIAYVLFNQLYVSVIPEASTALVYVSIGGTLVFIVLALASLIVAAAFFLGKWQKILRARFADGVPFATHRRFIRVGTLAFLWILVFPLLFMIAAGEVIELLLTGQAYGAEFAWGPALVSGPLILVLGFLVLYWLLRGLRAQTYLLKYKVVPAQPA